jgi:hypothetical protein
MGARTEFVAGLVSVLNTYKTANPTLLRGVYTARPDGVAFEKPAAWVGNRDETTRHDSQIRTRNFPGLTVWIADTFPVDQQTEDRIDLLVDGLQDAFTAAPHAGGGNTVIAVTSVVDTEVAMGDAIYRAAVFTFADANAQEGRP